MTSGPRLGLHLLVRCAKTGATLALERVGHDAAFPWRLTCRDHGETIPFGTDRTAKDFMSDSAEWCAKCAAVVRGAKP